MAMESLEAANTDKVSSLCDDVNGTENLGDDLLADLDSYLEDINDRLTISRMVSDSVIKGLVTAVTQEAAEKIAQKDLEVAELREMLHIHRVGAGNNDTLASLARIHGSKGMDGGAHHYRSVEAVTEYDRMKGTLRSLKSDSQDQVAKLKDEINRIRGCSSAKSFSSGTELSGLGGLLHEQSSGRWKDADKALHSLEAMMEMVFKGVEEMFHLSVESLLESKQEQNFQEEIEWMVIRSCIHSLEQEFEGKLWDRICCDKTISWSGKMKEISSVREELNSILKSLSTSEPGQLVSYGSLDSEGWIYGKSSHFHINVSGHHVENGNHEGSQNGKLESSDPNYLSHLNKDELVGYYKNELTKLKRNHESKVQDMTEEYFSLKREYLKERTSYLHRKKDKEFTTLRNRIPVVISKLDGILVETEKITTMSDGTESQSILKDRVETLIAENHQLRDFLSNRKKEAKCLARQVSDGMEKMLQLSLSEAKLLNTIRHHKSSVEDLHIVASVGADVFACLLRDLTSQMKCNLEASRVEYNNMCQYYESVIKEASLNSQAATNCKAEDSDMISIIMQGLSEVIFREAWQESKNKHEMLTMKYIDENTIRVSLEKRALENERTLETEIADKERLKQEIHFLTEEKKRLTQDAEAAHRSENERLQVAAKELENFRSQQQILNSQSSKESEDIKCDLAEALKEAELYKSDICKLNETLEVANKELREVDRERRRLVAVTQEKQNVISLHEANERDIRKQMESMVALVQGLSKAATDFECRVTKGISKTDLRLKNASSQSRILVKKANILKRTGQLYKQRLERRAADFQKAEAEVDLLGDEVDTLLSLLEKIYLALDHYSPVLQHYPGIVETLKLVKRELSGVSTRSG